MYGQRIKELRIERKMTQTELAKILNTTQKSISKYETEFLDLNTDTIIELCKFFNISADYLLGLETETGEKIYNSINYNNSTHNGNNNF